MRLLRANPPTRQVGGFGYLIPATAIGSQNKAVYLGFQAQLGGAARAKLPNRRTHEVRNLNWRGLRWTIGIGCDGVGDLAEVFGHNTSAPVFAAVVRDAAIILSIALQHGADLKTIRDALAPNHNRGPATPVGAALDALIDREGIQ